MIDGQHALAARIVGLDDLRDFNGAASARAEERRVHRPPSKASCRSRHSMSQEPMKRTATLERKPTPPRVIMAMTMVGYDEVAQAELPGDHFGGDERKPGDAD